VNKFMLLMVKLKPLSLRSSPQALLFVRLIFVVCLQFFIINSVVMSAEVTIPVANDLEQDGKKRHIFNAVFLLYFSAPDCRYCMKLEESVLKPMLRSGDYDKQVLLRKIDWRSPTIVSDFFGQRISLQKLSERYDVKVTPTLVFVDSNGREVAPRILGFQSADFFWHYLDHRIQLSRSAMNSGS